GEARVLNFSRASALGIEGVLAGKRTAIFSPDGALVVLATVGGLAKVFDVKSGAELRVLAGHEGKEVLTLAIGPPGKKIVTAAEDGRVNLWDRSTWGSVALIGHDKAVTWAAFDDLGNKIVTCSRDGTARLWDASTGTLLRVFKHERYVASADFSPDSER